MYLLCMDTCIYNKIIMKGRRMINTQFRLIIPSRTEAEEGTQEAGWGLHTYWEHSIS